MKIQISIGSYIELKSSQLSDVVIRQLTDALTIVNPTKSRAVAELIYGAREMPDYIPLYGWDDGTLQIPRGFVHQLVSGLQQLGIEIEWDDQRTFYARSPRGWETLREVSLRNYQEPACQAILDYENGVLQAPTGSGKSNVVLEAIRRAGQPALVIVDKTSLAEQWRTRCIEVLGHEPGMIGEGVWEEDEKITIALRQSLWARKDDPPSTPHRFRNFFDHFGFLCIDEEHHVASAETLTELVQLFPARWRIGVTATPIRDVDTFPVARAVVGPVIHETTYEDAEEWLVKPSVRVVRTSFDFDYRPTQRVPNPATGRTMIRRNNYTAMAGALAVDEARNLTVASLVEKEILDGHCCLVVSRRKDQLRALEALLNGLFVFSLTGDQTGAEAQEIAGSIEHSTGGCSLLSTVADEALDMPRLDRLFLVYPVRKLAVVEQQAGRIMRPHLGKSDALIYDFRDTQPLLADQHRDRLMLYRKMGWDVEQIEVSTSRAAFA